MPEKYSFNSVQTHLNVDPKGGHVEEVTESVSVRNGKGTKSVRIRRNNQVKTAKHKLSPTELKNIQKKTFMPNLFQSCHTCAKGKTAPLTAARTAPLMRNKKTQKKKPSKK